ncbi:MAG TPA: hypothetical protein VM677_27355, partial [Actinokineospora sp.]|nr:hypothetical protein [Actinokineospora sp.]
MRVRILPPCPLGTTWGLTLTDDPQHTPSFGYPFAMLARAMARTDDERSLTKVRRWQDVISGILDGSLSVGSRTPVADIPAWVTLEVAHGGFATGRLLAEEPLSDDELARVAALPPGAPGRTDRERLNLWYLGDTGQAELLAALRAGHYRIAVPEEAAFAVAAILLDKGFDDQALDLIAEVLPFAHRLRFVPRFERVALPSGSAVRLVPVSVATESLRAVRTPAPIEAMRATAGVWNPLYDRLVALWSRTVDGDVPTVGATGAVGGWPCQVWPDDWAVERARWLADHDEAAAGGAHPGRHGHPKSNFARLHAALLRCPADSGALSAREVGWIRRAIANTVTKSGALGSSRRDAIRSAQADTVAAPTYAALAETLAARLDQYPADGGIPAPEVVSAPVSSADAGDVVAGTPIPAHLRRKANRALEAPLDDLVRLGVITSGDSLATVLPQVTARLTAAAIEDPVVAGLHERLYAAFRKRRGLLLLNLASQVRFEELPWIGALAPFRARKADHAAGIRVPLVDEV